ncbi:MAG: hypothetical protein OSB19_06795 [Opitutaceae bacterium]|nr:hypothetical protein [Opitutaceae bacterium]
MKGLGTVKSPSRGSVLSSLFSLKGGLSRGRSGPGKMQLFGMSGTFGHGSIKHCDTWEFGEGNPENAAVRQDIQDIAERRRAEASERLAGEKKKGFYDFIVR